MWPYLLIAATAGVFGGLVAFLWSPEITARSAIQHFAAGAVLAAVTGTIIPELERAGTTAGILSGFVAGGALMIALKWFILKFERAQKRKRLPTGLAAAAAVDTLFDGAIISTGFAIGRQVGAVLAVALAVELFFLTLSVGVEFRKAQFNFWNTLAVTSGIACLLLLGALGARLLLPGASVAALVVVLAVGAAALIYLIAEELLVENVQAEESLFSTAMLFGGFLVLWTLKLLTR